MSEDGFEALADGSTLLIILLVASTVVLGFGHGPSRTVSAAESADPEGTRIALFASTLDELTYRSEGELVRVRNGTTVESFLRLEVHLMRGGQPGLDFAAANARIADLAGRLVRPGWGITVRAHLAGDVDSIRIPDAPVPEDYAWSGWTYPPLDGVGPDTVLGLAVWLSPRR